MISIGDVDFSLWVVEEVSELVAKAGLVQALKKNSGIFREDNSASSSKYDLINKDEGGCGGCHVEC